MRYVTLNTRPAGSKNYTSSSRISRPTTVAAFRSVLNVTASYSGSYDRSRAARMVCIRRVISALEKRSAFLAASIWRARTRLIAVPVTSSESALNSASSPAPPGSIVSLYGTGEGQTNPVGVDGKVATAPLTAPILPVQVFISNVAAEALYAGAAPGEVAGVLQVNVRVPSGIPSGMQSVVLVVGSARSQENVLISIS